MPVATDQRMESLALADEVRSWRKNLKADIRAKRVLLANALLSDAPHLQTMKVRDLLLATPGFGRRKVERAMRANLMSDSVRISRTSRSRREALLDHLAEKHRRIEIGWEVAK